MGEKPIGYNNVYLILLIIFLIAVSFIILQTVNAQILNKNPGFESGTFLDEWKLPVQNTDDAIIEIVTKPVRSGKYALHLQHQYVSGSTHNRCEIWPKIQLGKWTTKTGYVDWNQEYWLGFSVYLENWSNSLGNWNSIVQNHAVPNSWKWGVCDAGHNNWSISADNGFFAYNTFGRPCFNVIASLVNDPSMTPGIGAIGSRPYAIGISEMENRWIDIVINWITSDGEDGKIKIWVDGELVVELYGANSHTNDTCGLPRERCQSLTFGSYKSPKNTNLVSMYFDEIRIADERGSYDIVSPGQ